MKERPILFSAPMVRALLDGRKTQTRRLVKPKPKPATVDCVSLDAAFPDEPWCWLAEWLDEEGKVIDRDEAAKVHGGWPDCSPQFKCPYGKPGDRLWVKENFTFINVDRERNLLCIAYDADGKSLPTRVDRIVTAEQLADFMGDERDKIDPFKRRKYPAMFMNRWASRITLENEEIKVERLLDISEEDAIAEGLACVTKDGSLYKYGIPDSDGLPGTDDFGWPWNEWDADPRKAYFRLWDKIHGVDSHKANPWLWVPCFKVVKP